MRRQSTSSLLAVALLLLGAALSACGPKPTPAGQVTVPACVPGEPQDELWFHEVIEAVAPALLEMDSYRYRSVYYYKAGDLYPEEELALEVVGAHSGLVEPPEDAFAVLSSQVYRRSHVTVTDLHNNAQYEIIITEDGLWIRPPDSQGWVAIDGGSSSDLVNLPDLFNPQSAIWMLVAGGTLAPGVTSDAPVMAEKETVGGTEAVHRCWPPGGGYLVHAPDLYTFLENVQIHLWTTPEDTELVRLAVVAQHTGERYFDEGILEHDPPNDFVLWMELSDVNERVVIEPPPSGQVDLTLAAPVVEEPHPIEAPHNELPVPSGARPLDPQEYFAPWDGDFSALPPREYMYESVGSYFVDAYFGSGWANLPFDRRAVYETELDVYRLAAFFLDEMAKRGWQLKARFLQLGDTEVYLAFTRDEVILPIVIEESEENEAVFWAVLPPGEELLAAILSGWQVFSAADSGLASDDTRAVAFDAQGRAWVGTGDSGVSVFDGETWTTYNTANSGLAGNHVIAIAFDTAGRAWISTWDGVSVFDGETWITHTQRDLCLDADASDIGFDGLGRVWLLGQSGIGMFDGETCTARAAEEVGSGHDFSAMAIDEGGRVWVGTEGGGVFVYDDGTWSTIVEPPNKNPNTVSSGDVIQEIAFDDLGRVWIRTGNRVSIRDGTEWTTHDLGDYSPGFLSVDSFALDPRGRGWVVSWFGCLFLLEPSGEWETYSQLDPSTAFFWAETAAVDPQGRVWITTGGDGVAVFTPPEP